ncbi:uncharacterized protein PGRI_087380 [Penicillium griseofulvum]|uniref:Uncharacterized protein n=1 Tax=Penicillium patulum TaxID=5078 RepID=A0A135LTZ4_PENPA|nr:uncharacterized protein PGRI_087380 [Penicillium griseofulvum]KXG52454.1 hypothetical protein PGRI_087380 [Penicillium griseofulvum]
MDHPNPPVDTSRRPASDFDETSTSIHPTSEIPATSGSPNSPRTRSSSVEGPFGFGYSGYRSPLSDFVFSTPSDPGSSIPIDPTLDTDWDPDTDHRDPFQSSDPYAMGGTTPFQDPEVFPSSSMNPVQTVGRTDLPSDPSGKYTPEQFARILAFIRNLRRALGALHDPVAADFLNDPHAIRHYPHLLSRQQHERERRNREKNMAEKKTTEAERRPMDPEQLASPGPAQPSPRESSAPESSLRDTPAQSASGTSPRESSGPESSLPDTPAQGEFGPFPRESSAPESSLRDTPAQSASGTSPRESSAPESSLLDTPAQGESGPSPRESNAPESSLPDTPTQGEFGPSPRESSAPEPSLPHTPAQGAPELSPQNTPAQDAPGSSQTTQSEDEASDEPARKRARYTIEPKSPTPGPSTITSASAPTQRRGTSSRVKTTPSSSSAARGRSSRQSTPAATPSSSRRSGASTKTEGATPGPSGANTAASSRRLHNSDIILSANKVGRGNPTPRSWDTALFADKMMSQMKQTTKMSWRDIAEAWNANLGAGSEEMNPRGLTKRWHRIQHSIGVWPGFDEALLEAVAGFDGELDEAGFAQIAEQLSAELGWEVSAAACQGQYKVLKAAGRVDVKGKGRAK